MKIRDRDVNAALFIAFTVVALMLVAAPSRAEEEPAVELKVGDQSPTVIGIDENGNTIRLADHYCEKFLVIYFYPADFTTGCTRQAELWRDNMNALSNAGIEVIGVSADSAANHKLFKKTWKLNYPLIADEDTQLAKKFGVPVRRGGRVRPRGPDRQFLVDEKGDRLILERKATILRWTFIIDRSGKIVYKNTRVNPLKDSEQVLAFVKNAAR